MPKYAIVDQDGNLSNIITLPERKMRGKAEESPSIAALDSQAQGMAGNARVVGFPDFPKGVEAKSWRWDDEKEMPEPVLGE